MKKKPPTTTFNEMPNNNETNKELCKLRVQWEWAVRVNDQVECQIKEIHDENKMSYFGGDNFLLVFFSQLFSEFSLSTIFESHTHLARFTCDHREKWLSMGTAVHLLTSHNTFCRLYNIVEPWDMLTKLATFRLFAFFRIVGAILGWCEQRVQKEDALNFILILHDKYTSCWKIPANNLSCAFSLWLALIFVSHFVFGKHLELQHASVV